MAPATMSAIHGSASFIVTHRSDPLTICTNNMTAMPIGSESTIADLARLVKRLLGYEGDLVFDPKYPDGSPRKLMDSSRLFALGWRPKIELETGIPLAYADYLARFGAKG